MRQQRRLTRKELAAKVSVTVWTIRAAEIGIPPRLDVAYSIAHALGCKVEDIWTVEFSEKKK